MFVVKCRDGYRENFRIMIYRDTGPVYHDIFFITNLLRSEIISNIRLTVDKN